MHQLVWVEMFPVAIELNVIVYWKMIIQGQCLIIHLTRCKGSVSAGPSHTGTARLGESNGFY